MKHIQPIELLTQNDGKNHPKVIAAKKDNNITITINQEYTKKEALELIENLKNWVTQ